MGNCFRKTKEENLGVPVEIKEIKETKKFKDSTLLFLACRRNDINELERLSKTIELTKSRILYCGVCFETIDNYKKFVKIIEDTGNKVNHKSVIIHKIINITADKQQQLIPHIIEEYKVSLEDKDICFIIDKIKNSPSYLLGFYYKYLSSRKLSANIYEKILLTNCVSDSLFTTLCKDMSHLEPSLQLTIMSKYQSKLLREQNKKTQNIILYFD